MMNRSFIIISNIILLSACSANRKQVTNTTGMPPCLASKIQNIISDPKQTPPQSVAQFNYNGKPVFYIVQPCCDQYNEVYDSECNYLGAPDGGITGKGDGKLTDFNTEAKDKVVVWESRSK